MKILGTILIILGIFKLLSIKDISIKDTINNISENSEYQQVNPETVNTVTKILFALETMLEIICGLFIALL